MNEKTKVIIDCDPGIDDSLAILLALNSPELDVIGITTVSGNVPSDLGAKNALKILQHANRLDIPVYQGASLPLKRDYVSAQDTHGDDGLGDSHLPEVTDVKIHQNAPEFISQALSENPGLMIIAIGPMTNIALSMQANPKNWENCGRFISMGGNFKSFGNCSPVAEYNYWCDPDASAFVYENSPVKIEMIGLDVTRKIVFTPNILEFIRQNNPKEAEFFAKITRFYFDFHWEYEKVIGCVINDPLAVAYSIFPELCHGFDSYTAVETKGLSIGQTLVDEKNFWKKDVNSHILTKVDSLEFMKIFLNRTCNIDMSLLEQVLPQITK